MKLAAIVLVVTAAFVACGCYSRINPLSQRKYFVAVRNPSSLSRCNEQVIAFAAVKIINNLADKHSLQAITDTPPHPRDIQRYGWQIVQAGKKDRVYVAIDHGTVSRHNGVTIFPGNYRSLLPQTKAFLEEFISRLRMEVGRANLEIGESHIYEHN